MTKRHQPSVLERAQEVSHIFCFNALYIVKEQRKDRDLRGVSPGSYNFTLTDKKKDPSFSMGAKFQTENTKLKVPGAGSYDPKYQSTKLRAAGWRIGTETRPGMVQKGQKFVPGAGNYNIPSRVAEGPKIGMHMRTDNVD